MRVKIKPRFKELKQSRAFMLTLAISNSNYHYVDPKTNRENCSFATDEPSSEIGGLIQAETERRELLEEGPRFLLINCESRGRCNSLAIYSLERATSGVLWFLFVPVV